jgi:hypothetical protein
MRLLFVSMAAVGLLLSGSARASIKVYDASRENGTPGDNVLYSFNLCPPIQTTLDILEGHSTIVDDGLGTVTLIEHAVVTDQVTDISGNQLVGTFGPGAFFFGVGFNTRSTTIPNVSQTSGIGTHGPSSTAPGASVEWGVLSGFTVTGFSYCISSPVAICNENVTPHGMTAISVLNSPTYDLGTWWFDATGDMEASPFIYVIANGGLTNGQSLLRGAFQGASLPAVPLVGFGALACSLVVIGAGALRRSR